MEDCIDGNIRIFLIFFQYSYSSISIAYETKYESKIMDNGYK